MPDVEGLDGLLSKLEGLDSLVKRKNAIVRALRAGAEPIRARAGELAPFRTGRLKESMMITVSDQTATGAIAKIGPSREAPYGSPNEFGTAHMAAHPFLKPAYDEKVGEATRIIGERLAAEIEKAMR